MFSQPITMDTVETEVRKVYLNLVNAISNVKLALLFLLDLTTAFDMADHNILLWCLKTTFGFFGILHQLLGSYLKG